MLADYDVDLVARLLGVAFSEDRFGQVDLTGVRVDPGMPRAASDPSKSGTQWALCVDVQRAFEVCTLAEARAVWCKHVLGLSNVRAARAAGVAEGVLVRAAQRGVDRMTKWLNGEDYMGERGDLPVPWRRTLRSGLLRPRSAHAT